MGDTFIISGLKEKRSSVAGRIVDLRREAEKLQAYLVHIDAVLRLYDIEPEEIPTKGRVAIRSAYFGRNEISRRCRDMLREKGTIQAMDVARQAMRDKDMDPDKDLKTRRDFTRRILITLHDLRKAGHIEKIGHGKGVRWQVTG
jgi:ribosomal protein S14